MYIIWVQSLLKHFRRSQVIQQIPSYKATPSAMKSGLIRGGGGGLSWGGNFVIHFLYIIISVHLKSGLIKRGDHWWELSYKRDDHWWELSYKRGDHWWELSYKRGDLFVMQGSHWHSQLYYCENGNWGQSIGFYEWHMNGSFWKSWFVINEIFNGY